MYSNLVFRKFIPKLDETLHFSVLFLVFFGLQYALKFWPFSTFAGDLEGNLYIATHVGNLNPSGSVQQFAYPRLFHLPVYALYSIWNLSKGELVFFMIALMHLSMYYSIVLLNRSKGHSVGLLFVPFLISYGSYANVLSIPFLLLYPMIPSLAVFLILGFGYPLYIPILIPYMILKRHARALILGGVILLPYIFILMSTSLETLTPPYHGATALMVGTTNALIARRLVPLTYLFSIYFFFAIPVFIRIYQSFKNKRFYEDLIFPITTIIGGMTMLYIGWDYVFVHKYLGLLPVFSSITTMKLLEAIKPSPST